MTDQPYLEQPAFHVKAPHRAALLSYPGNFAAALQEAKDDPKKTLMGIAQGIPSVFLTKIFAAAKPDFVWIDPEHAMFDRLSLNDAIQAAQHHSEGKTQVIVRVPKHDETVLTTALDAGASGIIIPHCETVEEIQEKLEDIYYPPVGKRSFSPWTFTPGLTDASLYSDDGFNMKTSNNHILVIAQIESVAGIDNLDAIAAIPGVGALMFGIGDFSADAGIPIKVGGTPHPVVADATAKMSAASKKYNKPLFGAAVSAEMVPGMIEAGYRAICYIFDVWAITGIAASGLQRSRELAQSINVTPVANVDGSAETKESEKTNGAADGVTVPVVE